ncbi:MAG: GHKL domain-containing protein [Phycisphaerales bacterium]|nr:MAG: GHKL domain-containing protein [Phycisphaerales bacterium]
MGIGVLMTLFLALGVISYFQIGQANEILESEIREREKAERALEELNRDLEASVGELMRSNMELQEFSNITAHDLKTPLRGIATWADWISTDYIDKLGEQGREQMTLLLARAKKLDSMVDSVLQYSSIRQIDRKKRRVDINAVVSQVIAGIEAPEHVKIEAASELPVLICDEEQMNNVFRNLIDNAIKHGAHSDSRVEIGCTVKGGFWVFSIADNGPGIDRKYSKKIFRIFQTLSPAEQSEGTGIGLAIVRKIIELNGGKVWVDSEVGKGSTFYFSLPTHMNAPNTRATAAAGSC